jgi:hypothetical protein
VAGESRSVAGREEDRLANREAEIHPVVEADVAGAFVAAVGADVAAEVAFWIARDDLDDLGLVVEVRLLQAQLKLRGESHVLHALRGLRKVLGLESRVEADGDRGNGEGGDDSAQGCRPDGVQAGEWHLRILVDEVGTCAS